MYCCSRPQDHVDNKCEKKPVECPNNCGNIIVREEVGLGGVPYRKVTGLPVGNHEKNPNIVLWA